MIIKTLQILQDIVRICPDAGLALVPYYRQLLPTFNRFRTANIHLGDKIYYAQRKNENLADVIESM